MGHRHLNWGGGGGLCEFVCVCKRNSDSVNYYAFGTGIDGLEDMFVAVNKTDVADYFSKTNSKRNMEVLK